MGEASWIERLKWPDISHYRHQGWLLGEDENGTWFELKVGHPIYRGDEVLFLRPNAGLVLVPPPETPWMAWFPVQVPSELFEVYVDVSTPHVVQDDGSITMVDLDLDVVRMRDGSVRLLDEDEFAEHQVLYGYPPEIVALAESASKDILSSVQRGEPPFDGTAAATWAARAGIDLGGYPRPHDERS